MKRQASTLDLRLDLEYETETENELFIPDDWDQQVPDQELVISEEPPQDQGPKCTICRGTGNAPMHAGGCEHCLNANVCIRCVVPGRIKPKGEKVYKRDSFICICCHYKRLVDRNGNRVKNMGTKRQKKAENALFTFKMQFPLWPRVDHSRFLV